MLDDEEGDMATGEKHCPWTIALCLMAFAIIGLVVVFGVRP